METKFTESGKLLMRIDNSELASEGRYINGSESCRRFARCWSAQINLMLNSFYLHLKKLDFVLTVVVIVSIAQYTNYYV